MISGLRFIQILRYLHLSDRVAQPERNDPKFDKLYKIRDFQDRLMARFIKAYNLPQKVSFDEIMVAFKGRNSMKQYIQNKPIKRGFRIWALSCADSGYIANAEVYTGADQGFEEDGLGERVVKKNCAFIMNQKPLLAVTWMDRKQVTFLSTCSRGSYPEGQEQTARRRSH